MIVQSMRQLEKEKMTEMEKNLSHGVEEPDFLVNLFPECVKEEMNVYSKSWEVCDLVIEKLSSVSLGSLCLCNLSLMEIKKKQNKNNSQCCYEDHYIYILDNEIQLNHHHAKIRQ